MPITPLHIGPGTWVGLAGFRLFHLPALLVGCVIVDVEPFLVLVFNLNYPLHGFFHTLAGGTFLVLAASTILWLLRKPVGKFMAFFKLDQTSPFWKISASAFAGMTSHVFVDAIFHRDILPFFPATINPFYGLTSRSVVIWFCVLSFLAGLILYIIRLAVLRQREAVQA